MSAGLLSPALRIEALERLRELLLELESKQQLPTELRERVLGARLRADVAIEALRQQCSAA